MQDKQERQEEVKQEAQEEKQAEGVKGQPKITYSKATVTKDGDRVKLDCAVEGVDLSGINDFTVSWSKVSARGCQWGGEVSRVRGEVGSIG